MDSKETARKLNSLIQLDADAVAAYDQAIEHIDETGIREQLERYRDDHKRHISALSEAVKGLGEDPVKPKKDFAGFVIEGFTRIRSIGGAQGALKAMETNERLTNKRYADATKWSGLDPKVHEIIQTNYEDERKHLTYLEKTLGHKVDVDRYAHA
ncbi:MAG: DUF2383 domain-containing protein [Chitinivibrionales bacterium]|nr:DUF2383 domain-containing protein [Chitinivibrionales bacterium]MBD3357656.1 DUF2383 domain-containing protein [Chitinivibrionales bacterium]